MLGSSLTKPFALGLSKGFPSRLRRKRSEGLRQAQPERISVLAALLLLLAACQRSEEPANKQAPAPPPAAAPPATGDVSTAERLVRERLGDPPGLAFANARRGAGEGATIVCGDYLQGGARQRYIVVGGEDVFVEPQMRPGQMDRAYAEFCLEGELG